MPDSIKFTIELRDLVTGAAKIAGKSLASLGGQMKDSGKESGLAAGEFVAVGAAAAMVAREMASLTLEGAKFAIEAVELRESTIDALDAFMGSSVAARETYDSISAIQDSVAISQARGAELAKQLSAAGVTNAAELQKSIKTIGEVESVIGGEAGGKLQMILERAAQTGQFKLQARQLTGTGVQVQALYAEIAKKTGKGVKQVEAELKTGKIKASVGIDALNTVLDEKFGAAAGRRVLDLNNQFQRFKDNVMKLFDGVNIAPFLEGLKEILSVFDQTTTSGKALKFLVTSFFDGLFKVAKLVAPYVTAFLKGLVIIGLKIFIAMKPVLKQFGLLAPNANGAQSLAKAMSQIGDALAVVVPWAVRFIGVLVQIQLFIYKLPVLFYDAGKAIIVGLVNGIKDGGAAVIGAVKDVATSALTSFKGIFGIASPSRVMAQMGEHMATGLAMGLDRGADKAQDSLMGMVTPPKAGAGASSATGGGNSITVNIDINGVSGAEQLRNDLEGIIVDAFERIGLQTGAALA